MYTKDHGKCLPDTQLAKMVYFRKTSSKMETRNDRSVEKKHSFKQTEPAGPEYSNISEARNDVFHYFSSFFFIEYLFFLSTLVVVSCLFNMFCFFFLTLRLCPS